MLVNDNSPLVRFPELQSDVVPKYQNGVDADTLANTITFFGIHPYQVSCCTFKRVVQLKAITRRQVL